MINYLLLHGLLSLIIGGLLYSLRNARPRLRFYMATLGVFIWALPIPMVTIPVSAPSSEGVYTVFYELVVSPAGEQQAASNATFSLLWIFAVLSIIGLAFWIASLVNHYRQVAALKRMSRDGNHLWKEYQLEVCGDLRIIPGSGAMTTGMFQPVVFIGEDHLNNDEFIPVLIHESTHIKQRDNAWIFGINLLERFFWWNPILRFLATRARFYIELSCDQVCRMRLGLNRYRSALAGMMLRSVGLATPVSSPLVAPIMALRKENIQRIKLMDRSYASPWWSVAAILVFVLASTALIVRPVVHPLPPEATTPAVVAVEPEAEQTDPAPLPEELQVPEEIIARVGQDGVSPPVFIKRVAPEYPKAAIDIRLQGYVIVEAILRADGSVTDGQVLRGLGKGKFGFEDAALNAIRQWEYLPGKVNDEPADVRMTLKIDFVLE